MPFFFHFKNIMHVLCVAHLKELDLHENTSVIFHSHHFFAPYLVCRCVFLCGCAAYTYSNGNMTVKEISMKKKAKLDAARLVCLYLFMDVCVVLLSGIEFPPFQLLALASHLKRIKC